MGGVEVLVVGLTGGIATGKSTVAAMFVKLGAFLIDSDQIARQIVAPGSPVLAAIVAAFGPGILKDGQLDREKLGRIIFSSAKARARLNSITHPPILERLGRLIAENRPHHRVLLVDIPLLYEAGAAYLVDRVVVVYADEKTQLRRLRERDGISLAEAKQRINAQMSMKEKVSRADHVIDNSRTEKETWEQVQRIWGEWIADCPDCP
ncbi:MAG: dephospho-CoA kinase [Firmicutes bacterium]|jgi:dephospho-CoA kinase|nr:dephospho-CoA kinase [Bacillota bacterium]